MFVCEQSLSYLSQRGKIRIIHKTSDWRDIENGMMEEKRKINKKNKFDGRRGRGGEVEMVGE